MTNPAEIEVTVKMIEAGIYEAREQVRLSRYVPEIATSFSNALNAVFVGIPCAV